MPIETNKLVTLEQLGNLATRTVAAIAPTFKSLSVSGNTVSFFTSTDGSGTAAATFDFPEEIFLDQASTTLVENFEWSGTAYPNSTNPNLNGKTVLVLGVKGDKETNPTVKYSFIDLSKLIDTYAPADNSINISGYNVSVKISSVDRNALELKNDGLYVASISDDVITKVTDATAGNLVAFSSDGKIADSTYSVATLAEVTTYLDTILPISNS